MNARKPVMASFGAAGFLPLIVSLFLAMFMMLPVGTGAANIAMPHLVMIAVFYWTSSRPILMPYGACLILGFLIDLWLDVPMGLNMMLLLLLRLFVVNQLKHYKGRSRLVHWVIFGLVSFGLFLLSWLTVSAVYGKLLPVQPLALQWAITAFSYAPVGFILGRIRRAAM